MCEQICLPGPRAKAPFGSSGLEPGFHLCRVLKFIVEGGRSTLTTSLENFSIVCLGATTLESGALSSHSFLQYGHTCP